MQANPPPHPLFNNNSPRSPDFALCVGAPPPSICSVFYVHALPLVECSPACIGVRLAEMLDDDASSCDSRKRSCDDGEGDTDCIDTWSESSSVQSMSPSYSSSGSGRSSAAADAFSQMALLSYGHHHQPKRSRSASFDAILDSLPDEGQMPRSVAGLTSSGHSEDFVLTSTSDARRTEAVFPHPAADVTPTQSPTSPTRPSKKVATARASGGNLLESSEKPNFLQPLSMAERKKLRLAGRGAAIIRVNSELSFS